MKLSLSQSIEFWVISILSRLLLEAGAPLMAVHINSTLFGEGLPVNDQIFTALTTAVMAQYEAYRRNLPVESVTTEANTVDICFENCTTVRDIVGAFNQVLNPMPAVKKIAVKKKVTV